MYGLVDLIGMVRSIEAELYHQSTFPASKLMEWRTSSSTFNDAWWATLGVGTALFTGALILCIDMDVESGVYGRTTNVQWGRWMTI